MRGLRVSQTQSILHVPFPMTWTGGKTSRREAGWVELCAPFLASSTARRAPGKGAQPFSRFVPEGCPTNAGAPLTPADPHRLEPEEEREARHVRAGQVFRL